MKPMILMVAACPFIALGISLNAQAPAASFGPPEGKSTLDEDLAKLIGKWELPPKKNAKGGMDRLEMEVPKSKNRFILRRTSTRKSGEIEVKENSISLFAFRLEQ